MDSPLTPYLDAEEYERWLSAAGPGRAGTHMLASPRTLEAAISLAAAFFSVELVVAPIWAVPMDIAPKYSGSASGMMNFGFGVAGNISPFVFGYLIDKTGSWTLPFAGSIGLLLLGAGLAFRMHPERPFEVAPEGGPS